MAPFPFKQIFAVDTYNSANVAKNASILIYAPGDVTKTPLTITDASTGMIRANPVMVNDNGFGPTFMHETLPQVAWEGGGFEGTFESYEGMRDEAIAAKDAAEISAAEAEASKLAAQASANLVGAPANEAIAAAIAGEGPTKDALDAGYALKPDTGGKPVGKGELVFNVKDYGAVGDGTTDDTAAVQLAMDAAAGPLGQGGTLFFPAGEYFFKYHVVLRSNITITGPGATIRKKGDSYSYVCFASFSGANKGYGSGANNVTVHDIKFRGSFEAVNPRGLCAFSLHHAKNFIAYNLRFTECAGQGHQFDLNGCDGVTIRDSLFEGFRTEWGLLYNESIQIDNSMRVSSSIADADTSYDGLPTKNVLVDNCRFMPLTIGATTYPAPIAVGSHGICGETYYTNITITNCLVDTVFADTAGSNPGPFHFYGIDGLLFKNNTIIDRNGVDSRMIYMPRANLIMNPADAANPGAQTSVTTNARVARNVTIEGNRFYGFTGTANGGAALIGIYGDPGLNQCENIKIRGNTFQDVGGTNTALNNGQICVAVTDAKRVELSGNTANKVRRLFDVRAITGLKVQRNEIETAANAAINIASSSLVTVTDNIVNNGYVTSYQIIGTGTDLVFNNNQAHNQTQKLGRPVLIRNMTRVLAMSNILNSTSVPLGMDVDQCATGTLAHNIVSGFTTAVKTTTSPTITVIGTVS